jgi:chitin synthase
MVVMRYTAHVGFVGYTPNDVRSMASTGPSVAIYNGLLYDMTTYLASPLAIKISASTQPPSGIDVNFMSGDILELFQLYGGTEKRLNSLKIDRDVLAGRRPACARSKFTSAHDENSHFGSESYAPSRNTPQNTNKRGLMEKETRW